MLDPSSTGEITNSRAPENKHHSASKELNTNSDEAFPDLRRSRSRSRASSRASNHYPVDNNHLLQSVFLKNNRPKRMESTGDINERRESVKKPLTRSVSTHSFLNNNHPRNKNIPMIHETPTKPSLKRWNSYLIRQDERKPTEVDTKYSSKESNKSNDQIEHKIYNTNDQKTSSISPLTVLKNDYNIKRPGSNPPAKAKIPISDNSFIDLDSHNSNTFDNPNDFDSSNKPPSNDTIDSNTTTFVNPSNKLYSRMSQLINMAHNSMHSLVPIQPKTPMSTASKPDTDGETLNNGTLVTAPHYQSELDDDDEEEDEDNGHPVDAWNTQNNDSVDNSYVDNSFVKSPVNDLTNINPKSLNDILREIKDFQSNFVKNISNPPSNNTSLVDLKQSSRVQRKILDYKDLYNDYEFTESSSEKDFGTSNDYTVKIQHDTIMSEYTQIRLRFASTLSSINPKTQKEKMRSHMGVLGFVNRAAYLNQVRPFTPKKDQSSEPPWYFRASSQYESLNDVKNPITFENKDEFLKTMWDEEMKSVLSDPTSKSPTDSTVPSNNPKDSNTPSISPQMTEPPLEPGRLSRNLQGSYDASNYNFSSIARNVKLNH